MHKRKYVGVMAGVLAVSLAVAGIATAGTLKSQSLTETVVSGKQDKKMPGPITSLKTEVDTAYDGTIPFDQKAVTTKVDFDKDFSFTPGSLGQCAKTSLDGKTTEQATAACPTAIVGTGNANLAGPVAGVTAVVTAFNGVPQGGRPVLFLHSRVAALSSTSVLVGVLGPSTGGGLYGKTLDVTVPILDGGFVITHFEVTIPKGSPTVKKNKKKGKPAKYYVMAKCSGNKTWDFGARSIYNNGATTAAVSPPTKCKQKAKKKKKK